MLCNTRTCSCDYYYKMRTEWTLNTRAKINQTILFNFFFQEFKIHSNKNKRAFVRKVYNVSDFYLPLVAAWWWESKEVKTWTKPTNKWIVFDQMEYNTNFHIRWERANMIFPSHTFIQYSQLMLEKRRPELEHQLKMLFICFWVRFRIASIFCFVFVCVFCL